MIKRLSTLVCLIVGLTLSQPSHAAVFSDDLVTNGKFDAGLVGWSGVKVAGTNIIDQYALDGLFLTMGQTGQIQSISQTVNIPTGTGRTTVSFYYRLFTNDTAHDYLRMTVQRQDTGEIVASQTFLASDGDVSTWTKSVLEAGSLSGKTVVATLAVVNDSTALTFVDIDTVSIKVESDGELVGIVQDTRQNRLRKVSVTVRRPNGTKIWTGQTNNKGRFIADHLPGNVKKYRVIVKSNIAKLSKRILIDWAKQTKQTFTLHGF
ncbi:MAG: hypothetical protein WCV88_05550 [Patescibacteria group bacterium]